MRVLVVDDHSLFRDGLTSLLRAAEIEVAGEAQNGEQGLLETRRLKPDLVLLDIHMTGMTGLQALRAIKQEFPEIKVVLLTVSDKTEDLVLAIESGANGYLLKSLDSRTFITELRKLERGEAALSGEMTGKLMTHIAQRARQPAPAAGSPPGLSEREIELIRLLAQGLPNREIAQALFISENTVKYHIKNILQKLDLKNRAEAAAYAVQSGLTAPGKDPPSDS